MAAEEVAEFRARHGLEDDSDFAFFFGGYEGALAVSRDVATSWDACRQPSCDCWCSLPILLLRWSEGQVYAQSLGRQCLFLSLPASQS